MYPNTHKLTVVLVFGCLFFIVSLGIDRSTNAAPLPQPTAPPPTSERKLEPALLKLLQTDKNELTPFIAILGEQASLVVDAAQPRASQRALLVRTLQDTANRAQANARALLATRQKENRARGVQPLWVIDAIAGKADRATILDLAALPEVTLVRADHVRQLINDTVVPTMLVSLPPDSTPLKPLEPAAPLRVDPEIPMSEATIEWNIHQIGADHVWNALNLTGSGVVVATMDTGVDWQHPALLSKYRGYHGPGPAIHTGNWFDASGSGYLYPGDGNGHGTHTMGTLVGGTPDHAIGVAPGAQWIAVKIFTNAGYAFDSGIHLGFQWLVAPEGIASLAPDIVSNSWGTDNGFDTTFRDDIWAVRATGILPIFSSGNNGASGAGTVGAPGSYSEAFTVGATDNTDTVANFSSRGPSPVTGETKPDIAAPGVNVLSSFPGGGYAALSGTSMAAPAVAGIAALLLEAKPNNSITDTMFVITSTALPLSTTLPNNSTGWGRADAYAAALKVTAAGILSGTITSGAAPLAGARVIASDHLSRTTDTTTDMLGHFQMPLSEDRYSVSVFAFGYAPSLNTSLWISSNQTSIFNADLAALPTGSVRGHITELGSGTPLTATVIAVNTPASTLANSSGDFSLTLPVGSYTLRVSSWAHRSITTAIVLNDDDMVTHDFALPAAPSIALVDSGAWYYGSKIGYYQQALDDLGYSYRTFTVTNPLADTPTYTALKPYSVTLWSSPQDSPDYIGAGRSLEQYLDNGGRLFLSGQDIAFWDGGGPGFSGLDYFTDRLHGHYVSDGTDATSVRGVSGEALQGITLTLNYSDSARNQAMTDVVAPLDDIARPLMQYNTGETAGLAASTCLPYRAAYLAFGLEGVGPANARRDSMEAILTWLSASPPLHDFSLSSDPTIGIGLPGGIVTHVVTLRNLGQLTDTFAVTLSGNIWPTTLVVSTTNQPLSNVFNLPSCGSQSIGTKTTISAGASRNTSDTPTLEASALSGVPPVTRTLVSKTPAPVLLVDDDRWYNEQQHYIDAFNTAHIPFDYFDTLGRAGPESARMQMYPQIVWFSAYDWFDPLDGGDEKNLAAYLNSGGRVFYSAQDYLAVRFGASNFARNYFGVITYTNDVTVTAIRGTPYSPISGIMGAYTLTYPYMNFSDYVTATSAADVVFIGNDEQASGIALRNAASNSKSVFFAFPFETIPDAQEPSVMAQIVGWLSPLGDVGPIAPTSVITNAKFTYGLPLATSNASYATHAQVTVTLPVEVSLVSLGDPSLTYDGPSHSVRWSGNVMPPRTLTWTVQLNSPLPPGASITAWAIIRDTDEGLSFIRVARTWIERTRMYFPVVGR